jgi:hypothetical protein
MRWRDGTTHVIFELDENDLYFALEKVENRIRRLRVDFDAVMQYHQMHENDFGH